MRYLCWLVGLACASCQALTERHESDLQTTAVAAAPMTNDSAATDPMGTGSQLDPRLLPRLAAQLADHFEATHDPHTGLRLAEVYYLMGDLDRAQRHFELFLAQVQMTGTENTGPQVHAHCRLLDIARQRGDRYQEHLHRGIGLLLLARRRSEEPTDSDSPSASALLLRAVRELQTAQRLDPEQGRASWYLACALYRLGRLSAARQALEHAHEHIWTGNFTPAERQALRSAWLAYGVAPWDQASPVLRTDSARRCAPP